MRRLLAAAVALSLIAPGPSFAAALNAVEPISTVSLPSTAVGLIQLPTTSSLPSAAALPTALPGVSAAAVIPTAQAALPTATAPGASALAFSPAAGAPQARTADGRPTLSAGVAALAAEAPRSPEALNRAYDASGSSAKSEASAPVIATAAAAPRRSGLTRTISRARAAAMTMGAAFLLAATQAHALPDGPGPVLRSAPPSASGDLTGLWVTLAVVAFIAGIWGVVKWQQRRATDRWLKTADDDSSQGYDGEIPSMTGGFGQVGAPIKAKGKNGEPEEPKSPLFKDVAGQDEAKLELEEVVDFLKNPEAYKKLHPRYKGPKGVLIFGPPGTGKTLLARAVANEADVPFVHRAGSDFINTYVGTGANNIRAAFKELRSQIKTKGGAGILFIDEIEAIGGARSGGSDRSEETRTINALLKEMDGFEKDNIIVIAATNMPDSLDPALVRGGRFGTKVPVGLPDVVGREKVLELHLQGAALAPDVDKKALAKQTPGLAGADLEQVIMDATKLAKRRGAAAIAQQDLVKAIDEFTTGKQRRMVMSESDRRTVAYHESGHAIVSHLLPDADPVRKVTIIPHGLNALGFMQAMPEEEKVLYSHEWLVDRIAVALGGRVAEKMMTGHVYSGAQNDLQQATRLAKNMVMQFGMSEEIGHVSYDMDGMRPAVGGPMSEETRKKIDAEVKRIIQEALARVETLLTQHRPALEAMAAELMEKETLRSEDMERILAASKP